jgi:hypothetical protein
MTTPHDATREAAEALIDAVGAVGQELRHHYHPMSSVKPNRIPPQLTGKIMRAEKLAVELAALASARAERGEGDGAGKADRRDFRLIESGARCAAAFLVGSRGVTPKHGRAIAEDVVAEVLSEATRLRDDIDKMLAASGGA